MMAERRFGVGKSGQPAFATRGIVEGFYGRPWTHPQRLEIVEFIAARGMNTFVYAPKDDPLMRQDWRLPYTGEELARLSELAEHCRRNNVEFVYCLSPGLSIQYSSSQDLHELCSKLDTVAGLGVTSFGLLLDDIPSELQYSADRGAFDDLAAAHVDIIGRVFDHLTSTDPAHTLIVCPTVYWGYGDEEYVVRLGRNLDPRVDFFWTGRAICSATIDIADAAVVARSVARPVTYWDNYPVNDVAMTGELHIGPYRGRDRHLYRFATGVIANGMELFESSKIAFATIADYLWTPEDYDSEASWAIALSDVIGNEEDLGAFTAFADNVRSSCLSEEDAVAVTTALERFAFEAATGNAEAGAAELGEFADGLLAAAAHLARGPVANQALVSEAMPWIVSFEAGAHALKRVAELLPGGEASPQARRELADYLERLRAARRRVFGDTLEMALTELIGAVPRPRDA